MKKTLVGLIACVLIAAGGFFGIQAYVQHRVTSEIDAAFEQIRSAGGKATLGKSSYDLWNRTLTIADVVIESAAQPPITAKFANLTASGISSTTDNRVSADLVEVSDFEISMGPMASEFGRTNYKAPKIVAKDLSGSSRVERPSAEPLDLYRALVAQFVTLSASSMTAPTVSAKIGASPKMPGGAEFTYSNFNLEGIKNGKIAVARADEATLMMTSLQSGKPDKMTGRMQGLSAIDFDANAVAALLDPQKAKDDNVQRMYRQLSAGTYEISSTLGVRARVDGFTIDNVGVRPSLVQLPEFLALIPETGTAPTSAQARDLLERTARLYEGFTIGDSRIRGLAIETPQGPFKVSAIQFNLDKGKSDVVLEGMEGRPPFKIGRVALRSFDVPTILRMSATEPRPSEMALLPFRMINSVEIKDVVAPFRDGQKLTNIDTFSANWDHLIGSIPTRMHLVTAMKGPLDPANPTFMPLLAAGVDKAAINADVGAVWSESTGAFALNPFKLEVGDLFNVSAHLSLANVPRGIFTSEVLQATKAAAQIEAGTLELSLRDLGALDIFVAQYARTQGVSRDAARSAIIDGIRAFGEQAGANPDVRGAVDAFVSFVTTPRQTLTLKLTPRAKVPAMQFLDLLKIDPASAFAQFRIEAQTGL